MKEITVKRVAPAQLPMSLIFQLNGHYRMELGQFVTIYDSKEECLYVNATVPEADVKKLIQYVSFEGPYINEDEASGGLGTLGKYISATYGIKTWKCLFDAWDSRRNDRQMKEAKELAEEILPSIKELDELEEPPISFNDYLAYYVSMAGYETKYKTFHNAVGYGAKYIFWLGYLAGTGRLQEEHYGGNTENANN